jgi:type IV pilus assembly protein PilN
MIDHQEARNQFLGEQIAILDREIQEITELDAKKQALLARMNVIQQLQRSRPEIVHLFDELVTTIPAGVYLTSVKHKGEQLDLSGLAESNARVSAYMRNIDASDWLTDPRLDVIQAEEKERERLSRFTLQVTQTRPRSLDSEG